MASHHQQPFRLSAHALAASLWLASFALVSPVAGLNLPRQTPRPTGTLDIRSWPLMPTLAPAVPQHLALGRRAFNTVCGYIGGNADLPATCMAGSHCVVDAQNKAVGCCPDEGDCATGIFTGCVDQNNPGGGVVDPHVFTCGAGNVCYKNRFEGGYIQYGCGTASDIGTDVALTASGEALVAYNTVTVSLRPTTTMATVASASPGSGISTDGIAGKTSSSHPSSTTGDKAGASKATDIDSPSKDDSSHSHVGAIAGGVLGGIAALALLIALGLWLWRRNKRSRTPEDEEEPKFISRPLASPENDYEGADGMTDARPAPRPPVSGRGPEDVDSWPIPPGNKHNVIGVARSMDTDQTPLTQENALSPTNNVDNFAPVETGSMPRRGGERPFWQQTGGGRTRNLTRA